MIRKAIDILVVRWPEVLLVVVLQVALMMFSDELVMMTEAAEKTNSQMPFWSSFLLGLGTMVMVTVWQMLYLGFLKTSATGGHQPCQPLELLVRGRPYFWKILFFQIMFGFLVLVVSGVVIGFLAQLIWKTDDVTKVPDWATQTCAMLALVGFIKPMLFIPARVVVYDHTVMQAVAAMRKYRISEIRYIFQWVIGGFSGIIAFMLLSLLAEEKSVLYYIFSAVYHVLFSGLMLFLTLLAVLWMQGYFAAEKAQSEQESE